MQLCSEIVRKRLRGNAYFDLLINNKTPANCMNMPFAGVLLMLSLFHTKAANIVFIGLIPIYNMEPVIDIICS